jgi:hypothetical protein
MLTTTTRRSVPGQSGTWFHLSDGPWAGFWMRQSTVVHLADEAAPAGASSTTTFSPAARVKIRMGTHTGYQFDAAGLPVAEKTRTLGRTIKADTIALATIANQSGTWFRITSGSWDGYWLRASDVVVKSRS